MGNFTVTTGDGTDFHWTHNWFKGSLGKKGFYSPRNLLEVGNFWDLLGGLGKEKPWGTKLKLGLPKHLNLKNIGNPGFKEVKEPPKGANYSLAQEGEGF